MTSNAINARNQNEAAEAREAEAAAMQKERVDASTKAWQELKTYGSEWLKTADREQSQGLELGCHLNTFFNEEHHVTLGHTLEDVASFFGMSADKMRSMRLSASLKYAAAIMGITDVNGYSWGRELVKGLKEEGDDGKQRLVSPEAYASCTPDMICGDADLQACYPNTFTRLSLMAEHVAKGCQLVEAAKKAAAADRAGYESVEDQEAEEAAAEETAAAAVKTPLEKLMASLAECQKAIRQIEDETERAEAIAIAKRAFNKAELAKVEA